MTADEVYERAFVLRAHIFDLCDEVDRLRQNPPGTCAKALFFGFVAYDSMQLDALHNLLSDVLEWRAATIAESRTRERMSA